MFKKIATCVLIVVIAQCTVKRSNAETAFTGESTEDSGPLVDNARTYGLVIKAMSERKYAESMGRLYARLELCIKYVEPANDLVPFMAAVSAYPNVFLGAAGQDEGAKFVTAYMDEYARFGEITEGLDDEMKEATYSAGCVLIADQYKGVMVVK